MLYVYKHMVYCVCTAGLCNHTPVANVCYCAGISSAYIWWSAASMSDHLCSHQFVAFLLKALQDLHDLNIGNYRCVELQMLSMTYNFRVQESKAPTRPLFTPSGLICKVNAHKPADAKLYDAVHKSPNTRVQEHMTFTMMKDLSSAEPAQTIGLTPAQCSFPFCDAVQIQVWFGVNKVSIQH